MKERPQGVKVLSIFHYVLAGLSLLFGLLFLIGGMGYTALLESGELEQTLTPEEFAELQAFGDVSSIFYVGVAFCLVFTVLFFLLGRTFWKAQNWGRILALVVYVFVILYFILALFGGISLGIVSTIVLSILFILLSVVILWYLFRKDVIGYFTLKKKH